MLLLLSLAVAIAAPLRLDVTPSRVVLGDDAARAALTITSATKPTLSANVGEIHNLRREGPETWIAEYVPPSELFPQVAIVAAVAEDEVAWTAIPLCGHGVAQVRTRRRARISVKIGGETFGPAEADAHGEALVPVIVPPGVHEQVGDDAVEGARVDVCAPTLSSASPSSCSPPRRTARR